MQMKTRAARPDNRRSAEAEARLRRIQEVAQRIFVERGYHRASLDAILARSGGSKATLLKYFSNKAGLLTAVLNRVAEHLVADAVRAAQCGEPRKALTAFGTAVLTFYVRPDALVIYRSVIAEGYRHPALARGFYYGAHDKFVTALAARLQNWHAAGLMVSVDPKADANRFLSLLRSSLHERGLLGIVQSFSSADIDREVTACVQPERLPQARASRSACRHRSRRLRCRSCPRTRVRCCRASQSWCWQKWMQSAPRFRMPISRCNGTSPWKSSVFWRARTLRLQSASPPASWPMC
jgi:AcrR family transcriptional regulator